MARNPFVDPNQHRERYAIEDDADLESAPRSHWSADYTSKKSKTPTTKSTFVERFSPPLGSRTHLPYNYDRTGSRQSSYHDSPPESYHDSPEGSPSGRLPRQLILEKSATFRRKLDSDGPEGHRRRVIVFLSLIGSMLLLMLIVAGIWIQMDIVKKRVVTGLNNVALSDVRTS